MSSPARSRAVPARVGEQHEREQPDRLGQGGRQGRRGGQQHPGQADRLRGELAALGPLTGGCRVALVEHQVQHVADDAHPLGELGGVDLAEPGTRRLDGGLRPADALRHRRLGDEEGAGDLRGGEAPDGAQGQGELRRRRHGRMAAEHEQVEGVVGVGGGRVDGFELEDRLLAPAPCALAAPGIHQPPVRDRDEPGSRIVGDALAPATAATPRSAPPARRPRTPRTARAGARACRAPAGPARAAAPRSRAGPAIRSRSAPRPAAGPPRRPTISRCGRRSRAGARPTRRRRSRTR